MKLQFLGWAGILAGIFSLSPQAMGQGTSLMAVIDEANFTSRKGDFTKFLIGPDKNHPGEPLLIAASKYFVFRFSIPEYQKSDSAKMNGFHREFETYLIYNLKTNEKNNGEAANIVSKELVKRFKEVLNLDFADNRITIVNTVLLFPLTAKLMNQEFGDYLCELLKDEKKHDVIRGAAAESLREYFPVDPFADFSEKNPIAAKKKDRDVERVEALIKYINRPLDSKKMTTGRFNSSGEKRFSPYLFPQAPAVWISPRTKKVYGEIVPTFMQILEGKLDPPPTLAEKFEAAIGICQIKSRSFGDYLPEPANLLVGKYCVEFGDEYRLDYLRFKVSKRPAAMAWKIQSKRMDAALTEWVKNNQADNVKNFPALKKYESKAKSILSEINSHLEINALKIQSLNDEVKGLATKQTYWYKLEKPNN